MPPALADRENADQRVNEEAWRRDGLGAMQNVKAIRARNPTLTAKQQHDEGLFCHLLARCHGKKTTFRELMNISVSLV